MELMHATNCCNLAHTCVGKQGPIKLLKNAYPRDLPDFNHTQSQDMSRCHDTCVAQSAAVIWTVKKTDNTSPG